ERARLPRAVPVTLVGQHELVEREQARAVEGRAGDLLVDPVDLLVDRLYPAGAPSEEVLLEGLLSGEEPRHPAGGADRSRLRRQGRSGRLVRQLLPGVPSTAHAQLVEQ